MTKQLSFAILTCLAFLLSNCSSNPQSNNESASEDTSDATNAPAKVVFQVDAVCIWDKIAVRKSPDPKGKWITSLSIGETLTYLGIDSAAGDKTYANIQLNDKSQGWAIKDFIVPNGKPVAMLKDADLYSRPDLLTKTDKKFSKMDIVSSIEQQDDWIKVRGKRSEGKWIEEGWVKGMNISYDGVDIATAKFAKQAYALENTDERVQALKDIIDNSDLSDSKFISELVVHMTELTSGDKSEEGDAEQATAPADSIQ